MMVRTFQCNEMLRAEGGKYRILNVGKTERQVHLSQGVREQRNPYL